MSNPLSRMPAGNGNNLSQNAQHMMNSQLLQQNQPKNILNQFPNQQQQPNMGKTLDNLVSATICNNRTNFIINIKGLNNGSNASIAINNLMINNSNSNQVATPQIQHQLIESFRLAVQAGLISADLLNTKLPQDVLSLLYQLFQTLNQYMNSTQKLNNLNKRRPQMPPQQFKIENEMINAELSSYKESLVGLQTKINAAHIQLKQMQNSNNGSSNSSPSNNINNETAISSLASAAAAAGVPLSDLPLIKDSSSGNQNQNAAQRSKLLELLNDNNSSRSKLSNSLSSNSQNTSSQFNRQTSLQPQSLHNQQKQTQSLNQNQNSLFSNFQSNQWSNFKMNENLSPFSGNTGSENSIIDDRITPFIPGQLWAGHGQSSIEDDPNCTPGSVSKPLLTETIDPESILSSLQRGNQWSNGVSLSSISDLSNSILNNNLNNNNNNNMNTQINLNNNNVGNNRSNVNSNQQRGSSNWANPTNGI